MIRRPIRTIVLSDSLKLSEYPPDPECPTNSWWLYDSRAGMYLSMRAKTIEVAFVEAINHWAEATHQTQGAYLCLKAQVDNFVGQFVEQPEAGRRF